MENKMSKSARIVMVLAMVSAMAACAKKAEPMPEPVVPEVADTGKL
jgi:predicted small lipoprotein YifL